MRRILIIFFPGLVVTFCFSCIRMVTIPIRNVKPMLVVEGSITTDSVPYIVNLSYSGKFSNTYQFSDQPFIKDALVTIKDDQGDSTECSWVAEGTYKSTDSRFIGTVGRSYTLIVKLADGKTYISRQEKLNFVPPIDSLTVVYDSTNVFEVRPTQFIVSANLTDQSGVENYYRWTASGYAPRRSTGLPCNIGTPALCYQNCEQLQIYNQLNILSDRYIDGNHIQQPAAFSPVYWFGKHFVEVKQYSLSRTAYQFWEQYQAQTNRTGSILDPLPSSLTGNVYNQADSNDIALGLFSASAVATKRIVIIPFFLQEYLLQAVAGSYIKEGDCNFAFPNTIKDSNDPPGWENDQIINMR